MIHIDEKGSKTLYKLLVEGDNLQAVVATRGETLQHSLSCPRFGPTLCNEYACCGDGISASDSNSPGEA